MRKAKVLTLTMSLSLGCLAMAACAGKPEEYTVMGAKDWNIKASESTFDYSEGVVAILADGTEKAVKVDDSDVEYGKAGSYSIIYYYGKNSSDGVEKTVKIYDLSHLQHRRNAYRYLSGRAGYGRVDRRDSQRQFRRAFDCDGG